MPNNNASRIKKLCRPLPFSSPNRFSPASTSSSMSLVTSKNENDAKESPFIKFFVYLLLDTNSAAMTEYFEIQSDIANLAVVEERLFHFCHECNTGNYYAAISVATLKAVENAIVHGNHQNSEKKVNIGFGTCRGGIFTEVTDQGDGFDFSHYGALPAESSDKGTGIFIIKSLADKTTYSDGGRHLRLEFMINGIDPTDALERITVLQQHFSPVAA